ncbi:MAG: molybdopterin converting factor subunit 1 [Gammaproteobacteria bacterium]|nr:molybdopterin converting factor subunit 1 [Gammaproteobacteria bacterium]
MAQVLFFASLAEALDTRAEAIELPADCTTGAGLVALLRARGEPWDSAFNGDTPVLIAINQEMTDIDARIANHDEIAFFPPVTGG